MKKNIQILVVAILMGLMTYSCQHSLPNANDMPEVCFTSEVLPIFQSNCAISGCHGGGSGGGDLVLSDYNSIMQAITPGDAKKSKAYQAIIAKWINAMPPDKPLPLEARNIIRIWIEQGAGNTTCIDTINTDPPIVDTLACFSRDILPILSSSCAITDCHDAITHQGDYNLSSYSLLMASELVKPGNPTGSKFYTVLLASAGGDRMPQAPKLPLSNDQIKLIYKWIKEGATNNTCVSACDTTIFTYSGAIDPIIVSNCKGCHSGPNPQKGVSLTSYSEVKAIADDGRLKDVINATNGKAQMPPSQKLIACKIRQIEKWIENGSLND
jgi:mono/diheme cytochrome c family protein